jgi:hypothetical protein
MRLAVERGVLGSPRCPLLDRPVRAPPSLLRSPGEAAFAGATEAAMDPVGYAVTRGAPGHVPRAFGSRLEAADRWVRARSADLLEAAAELIDPCADRNGPLARLKGISIRCSYRLLLTLHRTLPTATVKRRW